MKTTKNNILPIFLSLVLLACNINNGGNQSPKHSVSQKEIIFSETGKNERLSTKEPFDGCNSQWQQERILKFVATFSKPLEEIDALPEPHKLYALCGYGFKVTNEPVYCMIYAFEHQNQHKKEREYIEKYHKPQHSENIFASNGDLFFWGYTTENNEKSIYTLNELASVFAGEE